MGARLSRLVPQPLVGVALSAVALTCLSLYWSHRPVAVAAPDALLGIFLALALCISYKYPVHVRRGTKVCMGTIPLYLIAALLPPGLAATVAAAGVVGGTMLTRSERGLYLSDIATDAARWILVILAGSIVAHAGTSDAGSSTFGLMAAAVVLWNGDVLTAPLAYYPMTREQPQHIMRAMIWDGGVTEAAQYLLGLLGALVAGEHAWAIVLLLVPVVPLHLGFKNAKETHESTRQVLESMADAVDLRDPYTGGHSRRVAEFAAEILRQMHLQGPEVDLIVAAARVHDIGKIGIPDAVLLKDGRLTDEERSLMESHPDHGARLLARYPDFSRGIDIVRHHHEEWDGAGYPDGRKGQEIPFGARIIAVADSFDAMTSDRPYRRGMPLQKAAMILREGRGRQWDPEIVDAFLRSIADRLVEPATPPALIVPRPSDIREPAISA